MKKTLLKLGSAVFSVLTVAGSCYVMWNHGTVSAGYAVVPMVLTAACMAALNRENEE